MLVMMFCWEAGSKKMVDMFHFWFNKIIENVTTTYKVKTINCDYLELKRMK